MLHVHRSAVWQWSIILNWGLGSWAGWTWASRQTPTCLCACSPLLGSTRGEDGTKKVEQHGLASFSLSYLKCRMVIVSCLKCVYVRRLMASVCNGDIQYHMMLKKIFKPDQGEISFGTFLSSFCLWICFCSWGNSKRVLLVLLSKEKKPWREETQSGACLADRLALSHSQEEGKIRTRITLNSMSYPLLPTFH